MDQSVPIPRLLTTCELASITGIARWRLYELTRAGVIPHVRLGRSVRFDPETVAEWLRAGGTAEGALSDPGGLEHISVVLRGVLRDVRVAQAEVLGRGSSPDRGSTPGQPRHGGEAA